MVSAALVVLAARTEDNRPGEWVGADRRSGKVPLHSVRTRFPHPPALLVKISGQNALCARKVSAFNFAFKCFCLGFLLSSSLSIFAFKSSILTSRFVANGRFSASFRLCASHFIGCIDTSTYPAHLGTIIYWPDCLAAPEPAGTSLFCTGNGGKSLVAAKSFCIIPAMYTRTLLSCAVHGGRQEQTRIFGIPAAHKMVQVPPNMLRGSPQPKAATRRNSPLMGS